MERLLKPSLTFDSLGLKPDRQRNSLFSVHLQVFVFAPLIISTSLTSRVALCRFRSLSGVLIRPYRVSSSPVGTGRDVGTDEIEEMVEKGHLT